MMQLWRKWAIGLAAMVACVASTAHGQDVIRLERIATGLARPIFVTSPPGDNDRLFVAEQHSGQIRIINRNMGNSINATPFLTVAGISTGSEQGLLGMTFHPDYATNGQFFVNYTDTTGRTHIRRYEVSAGNPNVANAASALDLMTYAQPQSNHNGGWIGFNPRINVSDSQYLYIGSGDGGGGNDQGTGHTEPNGNAQDLTANLLGKMLRIDVNGDDFPADATRNYAIPPTNPFAAAGNTGDDEIWNYGLRNPWRSSFDRQNGNLYIGDVGQGAREEVDFQPATSPGGVNYGWRLREGTIQTPTVGGPAPAGAIDPIHEYNHDATGGFSITGGYVYRGPIAAIQGHYFFADYVSNKVWSFRYDGTTKTDFQERTTQLFPNAGSVGSVSSFGEDPQGNLYIVSLNGDIFRVASVALLQELVARGARWKYLDNGSNQGTAWRDSNFADGAWAEGPAELGYGDGGEATTVNCGPSATCNANNFVTTYFRKHVQIDDPAAYSELGLSVIRDDGVAVYINGQEVGRTPNLAAGAAFNTLANNGGATGIGGADESTPVSFTAAASLLQAGDNVIAAEIHQQSLTSSDISFDLRLTGVLRTLPGDTDFDGDVDRTDLANFVTGLGNTTTPLWSLGNFNNDGRVSLLDLIALQRNFVTTPPSPSAAVPEPASLTLVGLAGLAFLSRRRLRS